MSLDIWPPISPDELKIKEAETQDRELRWFIDEVLEVCRELKHGLEDCYALLAPVDPGSTLVMSTPRNERVKGTITRVGTRVVKGTLNLQLRAAPPQSIAISSSNPIHIPALDKLFTHLNQSVDLLSLTLSQDKHDPPSLASTLSILAESIAESTALLKGPPLDDSDPKWQSSSCPPNHFSPPLIPNLSLHFTIQESCIVLALRVLEEVDAPQHFGVKLGLALGTVRRLEHDEMDLIFRFSPEGDGSTELTHGQSTRKSKAAIADQSSEVYVREKIRVESADPSLISVYAKLGYLSHMLGQARRNLAAVMGIQSED